jgi:hypothetical protein
MISQSNKTLHEKEGRTEAVPKSSFSSNQQPIRFDWDNRWLRGEEYAHILNNIESYSKSYGLKCFEQKTHPESIYTDPQSKK